MGSLDCLEVEPVHEGRVPDELVWAVRFWSGLLRRACGLAWTKVVATIRDFKCLQQVDMKLPTSMYFGDWNLLYRIMALYSSWRCRGTAVVSRLGSLYEADWMLWELRPNLNV